MSAPVCIWATFPRHPMYSRYSAAKRLPVFLWILTASACASTGAGSDFRGTPPLMISAIDLPEVAPVEVGLPPEPGEYDLGIDVLHYDVQIVVPPENDRVSSHTTIHYFHKDAGAHW